MYARKADWKNYFYADGLSIDCSYLNINAVYKYQKMGASVKELEHYYQELLNLVANDPGD